MFLQDTRKGSLVRFQFPFFFPVISKTNLPQRLMIGWRDHSKNDVDGQGYILPPPQFPSPKERSRHHIVKSKYVFTMLLPSLKCVLHLQHQQIIIIPQDAHILTFSGSSLSTRSPFIHSHSYSNGYKGTTQLNISFLTVYITFLKIVSFCNNLRVYTIF